MADQGPLGQPIPTQEEALELMKEVGETQTTQTQEEKQQQKRSYQKGRPHRSHDQYIAEKNYTNEAFVQAWLQSFQEHTGLQGVADILGVTRVMVDGEAARLRNHGVKLPKITLRKAHKEIDAQQLNKMIKQSL